MLMRFAQWVNRLGQRGNRAARRVKWRTHAAYRLGRRAVRPTRSATRLNGHPVYAALTATVLAMTVLVCVVRPPSHDVALALTAMQLTVTAMVAVHPVPCLAMLTALDIAGASHMGGMPSAIAAMALALGLVAYRRTTVCSCLAWLGVCGAEAVSGGWPVHPVYGNAGLASMACAAALPVALGCALRWRERAVASRHRHERDLERMRAAERDAQIADSIHDAVSGELSLIARTAQRHARMERRQGIGERDEYAGGGACHDAGADGTAATACAAYATCVDGDDGPGAGADDACSWAMVNDWALGALADVHRIIDRLDRGEPPTGMHDHRGSADGVRMRGGCPVATGAGAGDGGLVRELKLSLHQGMDRLESLGVTGRATVRVLADRVVVPQELSRLIVGLTREVVANLIRHASPGAQYEISVLVGANAIEITHINDIAPVADIPDAPDISDGAAIAATCGAGVSADAHEGCRGHGLRHYRRLVERHGGVMTYGAQDAAWTLYVHLPLGD